MIIRRILLVIALFLLSGCSTRPSNVSLIIPPGPHIRNANASVGSSPVMGNRRAPVTILVFSDFECLHCKKLSYSLEKVSSIYPTEVKIVYKNLPLPYHRNAKSAAIASLAAENQGKFWEMHDKLFQNQGNLGKKTYVLLADELDLNITQFKKDLTSASLEKQVRRDIGLALRWGIQSTPRVFVNGEAVAGALPLSEIQQVIERQLALSQRKKSGV